MINNNSDGVSTLIQYKWMIAISIALAILLVAAVIVVLPLADGIVLGLVFAYISRPICLKFKGHRKIGAFVATMFIVIPIIIILGSGLIEIIRQITWIVNNQGLVIGSIFDFIRGIDFPETIHQQLQQLTWDFSTTILPIIGKIDFLSYAKSIAMFFVNLLVAIIVCFFLLADGEGLYNAIIKLTSKDQQDIVERYSYHLDMILNGVFIANAYAALFVSVTSLFVFYAFGFSHLLALATLIFIASIIPMFAGYMVIVPLSIIRYLDSGFESAAIFFVVASILIYAPPELILKPYFASVKSNIHPLLLMLAFLGGAFVGGIAGLFAAPILLGALVAAYRVYLEQMQTEKSSTIDVV
ncbi:MAG: AI-2E family transporter [Methanosarcinaceae archaeon]|nr:AI-2E family transporter [Methanosarcinaceae archaeon]MDF1533124.1 AI-2E family transporter [Methanosarcinaceae archaeon]